MKFIKKYEEKSNYGGLLLIDGWHIIWNLVVDTLYHSFQKHNVSLKVYPKMHFPKDYFRVLKQIFRVLLFWGWSQ
jgi:hypothetical protein